MNVDVVRQKLVDGDTDAVLKELVDLYRRAEILHTPQLGRILEALFPVWKGLLQTKLPPQLRATMQNRCRKVLLQILNRLPSNEALRPYVAQLLQLLMEVLQKDNEDNALIALKTLFDLHRNYRPALRNEVQPFLELVQLMYKNLQATMKKQFSGPPETHKSSSTVSAGTTPTAAKTAVSSATPVAEGAKEATPSGSESASAATTEAAKAETPVPQATTSASAGEASATATETTADSTKAATETTTANTATAPSGDSATDEPICSNLESFKTISELPLIIMLLFQCYPSYIESYIPVLVPLMMSALALRAPDTAATTHPSRYLDFLDCQVKTLSFVTYLLRGCANLMRPFQDAICENTVKLLIACPKDAFVLRKDIFVAARHIISTDFRRGFYPQLELLMNDDVLIGKGRCSFYQIRPLAYSTLADMIHHVRDMLTLTQVSAIVDFYGKRIHDPTLPISIQTTSIRLLLNLVDISAKNEDADAWKGRNILSRILLIISGKFGTTLANLPVALATTLRNKSASDRSDLLEGGAMDKIKQSSLLPKEVVQKTQYERKLEALLLPYMRVQRPADSISEEEPSIRDIKSLLRTMILGIRAVIWCTANYRNPLAKDLSTVDANTADASGIVSVSTSQGIRSVHSVDVGGVSGRASGSGSEHVYPLTDDERLLIAKVLRNGLRCFILYTLSDNTLSEEKQMLDHFAGAFTVLEAADFRDLFISNIELLYECILQDHAILTIPQHFLANSNVSCWFAEILLKFLITQMKDLSVEAEGDLPDTKRVDKVMAIEILQFEKMRPVPQVDRASIVLRLFKIVFGSVTLFKSNESALFPHLRTIIESCLKQATFTKHPDNYLLLLRALFRSISGGKYENFYKEVFPLLPGVLSALMRLQKHIGKPAMQEVLLELCLTIPARLSSLLQYLPSLMKSVVRAILSRGELAYLGLRTLEFWVDNLNPDFLYPIMTSQDRLLTEIIEALNTHLIPPPYPYGELAMRILGKIGGRNRQYLMDPLNLDYHEHSFTGLTFTFQWGEEGDSMNINMKGDGVALAPSGRFPMKMDVLVAQATKVLRAYLRNTSTDRNNVSKTDSRLADVDEFEEGENLAGPAFLLEKDDKTLHLETETMAKIRGSILQHKRCAFMFVSRAAVVSLNVNYFANADLVETDRGDVAAQNVEPMRKIMSQEALRVTRLQLLQVLFETVVDVDVGMEAKKVLDGIAGHLTVLTLTNCSRDQPDFAVLSSLHASTLYAATRGLSPGRHLATTKRIETLRQAAYGTSNMMEADVTNDFYSYVQAVSVALSSPDQQVVDAAKEVTTLIIKTAIDRFDSPRLAVERGGALFNCMCEVFSHGCYDKGSWRQKLGGAIGLQLLVDLLEPQWCHENELTIIKALFFVLSDHPPEVSATVSAETGEAMVNVVKTGWKVRSGYAEQLGDDDSKKKDFMSCVAFQDTEVFQMLVVEFLSPKAPTRQYAKQCINTIASLQESTASALLYPYNQLISKQITGCNLRMLPSNTRTGYVDAMAYALSLKPPIFSLTKEIMVFLQEVWKLISEDSQRDGVAMVGAESPSNAGGATAGIPGSGVSAQEYPFGLSQACELRIAAAKLLRAAFLAAPNDLNQHPEYRNRFVGVFFRYLTGQPPELVQVAQDALTDVIQLNKQNKDVFLPKELLQQCLRPVLLNLADYRKLNLPLLEGLSRLLTLLSSCFNVTLGEKLLEHLKQWRDPDRIIKAGIWKRGEEPAVAAAIVDLFHLLPPNDAFLEPLINCVVDLEAVLPKYGSYGKMSSPYRIPLTRFLNRYASMTVSFFLKREHLVEVKYSSLFQQLIKVPEAAPLHAVIIGDGGAESVVEATFNAALKINASEVKGGVDVSSDTKMQAQIQLNAQKAAAQAVATAQAQGMTASAAEARGVQARAAYVVKAQAQVNAQQALKVQSQVQIQANAQKLHAQTLAAAQAQGLSLVQAQAKAQFASKDYIAKAQSHISSAAMQASLPNPAMSSLVTQQQAQQLQAQIQVNAQKVHAQALATAQARGLKPMQAQEEAKQAQATYVHRANAQAQAKIARAQSQGLASSLALGSNSAAVSGGPFASKAQQEALELHYQGLRLVRSISKLHPTWLASQTVIIDALRKLWRSSARVQRLVAQDRLPIKFHLESKLLIKCMITYSRTKPEDVQVLLDMVSVFLHRTPFDFSFLQTFYREEVAAKYTAANKRNLIRLFLRMLREPGASEELKVHAVQLLIMPVLTASFEDPGVDNIDVMDLDTVMWMLREILASKEYSPDAMQSLRIELLKLGTLLIQHMSKYVTDHRKEVIKFAWNHLKAHDLTSKLWAYVNVCRFISVYDTPPKIVLQVYVALLRTHEMDARFLVRKAFDILLPALPSRLPSNEFIKAIKWTKKIAYEEGHVLGQLVHIWFLIVRHPALFYPFRGQFVPLMVNSLNRLAIPPSSTPDNRRLAVNIVDLVISWEQTRQDRMAIRGASSTPKASTPRGDLKRSPSAMITASEKSPDDHAVKKRKVLTTGGTDTAEATVVNTQLSTKTEGSTSLQIQVPTQTSSSGSGQQQGQTAASPSSEANRVASNEDDFELSGAMVDLVINFAFRFALASADKQETSRLAKTCGELFDKALRLWPSASIRFSYFDKLIAVTAETVIRQQQQVQASMNAAAAAAGGTGQQVPIPAPPPPTVMPPFFVVPKGAPLSSLAILDAVLGILNSLITPEVVTKSKRPVPYVIQYAPRIMKLLEPCFDRQNHEIQASLTKFLRRMTELYPPSCAPQPLVVCKFYPWLREIINERLVSAAIFQQELGAGGVALSGGPGAAGSKAKGKTAAQNASGSKPDKQGAAGSNAAAGHAHAGKHQKDPSGINPLINHEAARMRLLISQHPRAVVSPSSYPGEFTLKLLSGLAEITPEFVDHFAPALLKLAQRFTREHLIQSAATAGGGSHGGKHGGTNGAAMGVESGQAIVDSFGRNRVMATPSLAIINEWNQMQSGRSNLAVNNVVRHVMKRDASGEKATSKKKSSANDSLGSDSSNSKAGNAMKKKMGVSANQVSARSGFVGGNGKRPIELLVLCYALLAKCTFTAAEHRRLYTNLLVHCLEGSYNIPLLLQITRIVAKMIASTDPCHQVLSAKDKMTLLSKMATFDRLNEISALPLNEEYYQLVLKLCEPPTEDSKQQAPQLHLSPTPQSHSLTTHFMAGLLAPDPKTREKFLQIFFAVTGPGPVARLQLVLRQDWQACGTRYWPVIAIETLMAAISPNALLSVTTMLTSENTTPKTPAHGEFLETYGQIKASELTLALRDLAHIDLELAKELWVSLFSAVWGLLQETDQSQVSGQLLKILASKYNKRDLNVPLGASTPRRTNVVQTLMKGIVSTSPSAPVMTPELVLHLASAYDVWSCAIRLCEFQVEKSDLSVESRLRWIEALSAIYKQLSEDDLRIGLSIENIAQPETRTALTLEALGCVHEAQEEYFHALSNAQSGRVSVEDVNLFELRLWEERWVGCAKQLCQWQLMNDFAKSTQNQELLLDCAWKRGDWASAKQLLLSPSMQSSAELGCPQTRLQRLYISILDADKRSAIDTLASQTAELALHQWQGLPRILSRAHLPLMHLFHKFVEVKESIQMMEDIKSASAQHAALPNLKPSINTWRERLPNKWEPILLWDDILTWRSHMFQVVKTTFAWSDAQVLACMHDSPWSVIKLAHTARKQRLPDVCLGALAKLYSVPAMDVQDAFSKLREQVSICYESATEYSGGLSILNTTNLDYFSLRQKAEMFRLKALFLEAQGSLPEANKTFSHCLQICDSYGKGWLSWGHYCYRLFLVRKDLALASQTIACYLQAIHHRCNSARLMIARVLWLLNMDDRRGVLIQAFETHGKQLPIWIWIIWIPQLLMALGRPEAPQIRGLLRGLSAKFPQALYYTMRAFFLENRDNAMLANQRLASGVSPSASASSPAGSRTYYRTKSGHVVGVPITMPVAQVEEVPGLVGPPRPTPAAFNASPSVVLTLEAWTEKVRNNGGDGHSLKAEVGPVQYTEDLLNFLRRSHDSLTFEMECMLEEMITRFRPEPEEELLTAVHALLLKCYQLPRLTKTESVPKMLRAALARVCRKLFVLQPHQKNEKHEAFVEEFKAAFERDFTPLEDDDAQHVGAATTLYEIMNRLKRWKSLLQLHVKKVGKRNAGKLYLEQCSRHLMELSSSNMEVPGQYVSDSEPIKDLHARIQHFKSTVGVLLRNGFTQRRVAMGGSDGRTYYFLVQYAMTHITRTDERMMQMYLLLNRLLLRHKETKKRNTVFHVPKVIPLTPRVRLLEDNRDFVTLGEIYELDCQIENKDPDLPVELYRERVSDAYAAAGAGNDSGKQEEERVGQAKAHAFQEICNEHVPETLLAKYVHGISAHSDAYFQFRSEFTKHLALSSFLSYALFVGDRAPHRVLFSRRTGRVVSTELRPGYASSGILEAATTMPFRLTRNLHNFMTRPGVQGPFSVGMTAAAEALTSEEDVLSNQLCLFFRDDLLSWHASKTRLLSLDPQGTGRTSSPGGSSGPASPAQRRVESQVQQRVEANVSLVLERIRGVSLKKDNVESSRGRSVQELLEIATSPERQQEMYPTWSPWL
ncbi:hypothetical protein L916_06859 [Phytophthora nicotianae]|uniref:Non-specific serine/threonine protein kinase n=1 Tax=Phytophthora nicotianae TaxID=4792 RepID=W2J988_PHYNI|nr:hypothetical protein L916_06859 [Phytophthora nicotianae]